MPKSILKSIHFEVALADAGRLDVLVAKLTSFSRTRVRGLIGHGRVQINDHVCLQAGHLLKHGDQLRIVYDPQRRYREQPVERATTGFTVLYVDQHLVVVTKAAGILTVPTSHQEKNTLVERLALHLGKGAQKHRSLSIVHRLDRDTSGILVFGRTPPVAKALIAQFAAHKPERIYAAIVAGQVVRDQGVIRSHLVTDKALNQKSTNRSSTRNGTAPGELAVTHFQTEKRYADATLVSVRLETGRRNQIRVHFAEMGHPVLGDTRYQPEKAAHPAWPFKRLALHAQTLAFHHPILRKDLRFTTELPSEFLDFAKGVTKSSGDRGGK